LAQTLSHYRYFLSDIAGQTFVLLINSSDNKKFKNYQKRSVNFFFYRKYSNL